MHDHQDDRWERGWRKFERMARQFGRGANFGPRGWQGLGENFRIGRMLASGDVRLVALFLIEQQPRHGYDLIKAIEDKSQGFYSPSPGIVYPALTFLEEAGYVTSAAEGNKKLYTITPEGRSHLDDNRAAVGATLDFLEKAGAEVNKWRDMARQEFAGREDEPGSEGERPEPPEDFPFGPGRGPGGRGPRHRHFGHGPGRGFGPRPDRDIDNVVPELNEARREVKGAIIEALEQGEDAQRRVAEILRKAAGKIRRINAADAVDL